MSGTEGSSWLKLKEYELFQKTLVDVVTVARASSDPDIWPFTYWPLIPADGCHNGVYTSYKQEHSKLGSILSVKPNQNVESKTEKRGVQNSIFTITNQKNH